MTDYDKQLKQFENEFLSHEEHTSNIRESQAIKRDIVYFQEVMNRNTTSKFNFQPAMTLDGNINGIFVRKMWREMWSYDERVIEKHLDLLSITSQIFKLDDVEYKARTLIEWKDILEYFSNVNIFDYIHAFVGCSQSQETLDEAIRVELSYM